MILTKTLSKMLKLNFIPESNLRDYSQVIDEYKKLWQDEGEKIVKVIEKISNLKFQESEINAIVYYGSLPSRSRPLCLMIKDSKERRLSILIHELTHRIISGNSKRERRKIITSLEVHKTLFLILYDIWIEVYGKDFAKSAVEWEKNIPQEEYKKAWEWALSFNKGGRARKFKEIMFRD